MKNMFFSNAAEFIVASFQLLCWFRFNTCLYWPIGRNANNTKTYDFTKRSFKAFLQSINLFLDITFLHLFAADRNWGSMYTTTRFNFRYWEFPVQFLTEFSIRMWLESSFHLIQFQSHDWSLASISLMEIPNLNQSHLSLVPFSCLALGIIRHKQNKKKFYFKII